MAVDLAALRHTDFGGSNIRFDEATCTVTSVIDWAGVTLGDPAIDVAAILHMGDGFFARMVKTYPAMAAMVPRTRFFRSTYALQEALNALHDGICPSSLLRLQIISKQSTIHLQYV